MCSDLFPNFWLEADEEVTDLPYVARQELEEIAGHIARQEMKKAEAHLDDLTQFSLKIEDPLVQTKIRLEIVHTYICIGRLDKARIAVDFAVQLLDNEEARRLEAEATLIPIHNHYLAKSCLLLAGLEFRIGNNRSIVLANLQRCLNRLVSLSVYHREHLLTPGNSYKIWADIIRSTISSYVEDDHQDPWGAIPYDDGCISSGVWWRQVPDSVAELPAAVPLTTPSPSDDSASSYCRLEAAGLKMLPLAGDIAVGEYMQMGDMPVSAPYSGVPEPQAPGGQVSLDDPNKFMIGNHFYRLHDMRGAGGLLELDPKKQNILLRVVKAGEQYGTFIQPGDYVLVRGQGTARRDDLVLYGRREQNVYTGKLDKNNPKEIISMPLDGLTPGSFEDMPDHDEVKTVTLIRGVVLGIFKRIP